MGDNQASSPPLGEAAYSLPVILSEISRVHDAALAEGLALLVAYDAACVLLKGEVTNEAGK